MRKFLGLMIFCLLSLGLSGIGYFLYLILKAVFSVSAVFGLLFVFFVLPVLGRILFMLFFSIFSSFLAFSFSSVLRNEREDKNTAKDDGIIDIKCRVVK